jgi:hypothetical protein
VQGLQTIPLTWPFSVWGLDILGPFPRAQGGCRYLYFAIDKFTKWAEVEPVRTILAKSDVKFIQGLVCRFGMPSHIITDNGNQFTSGMFREYCASVGIKICCASVAYPTSNGQAKHGNVEVLKGLKTKSFNSKIKACGKKWLDNLHWGDSFLPSLWGGSNFLPMSSADRQGCSPSMSFIKKTFSATASSCLKRPVVKQRFGLRDTSKVCATTTAATFEQGPWRSGTCCSGGYCLARACTSYH